MKLKQILLSVILGFSMLFALNINDLRAIQGVNPTPSELNSYILKKCKETNIPPIIVKAILLKEGLPHHKWQQYSPDSGYGHDTIVYHHDAVGSYGLGLFQITYHLNNGNENEIKRVVSDWRFNVDKAFEKLLTKWKKNIGSMTGIDTNPLIIENWYYPIAWYNGEGSAAKQYVDIVYSYMKDRNRVILAVGNSRNSDTIVNYYKTVSNISAPYIIDSFRGDNIRGYHPQPYTLQQILDNGGELHIWDKSSNSYKNYEDNGNSGSNTNGITSTGMTPNMNNSAYKKSSGNPFASIGYGGQCTSFVWGRAYEKLGISIKFNKTSGRDAKNWLKRVVGFKHDMNIQENSIAVWGGDTHNPHGHVAFIEKIENGYVYFNEANWDTFKDTKYGGGYDGKFKSWTLTKFKKYRSYAGNIIGYIHLTSNENSNSSIVDGAGSLVSPNENIAGGNYDYALMQPHASAKSTVVFQWLYDIDSCSHIDLFSYPNALDVTIQAKKWSGHTIKKAFNATLNVYNSKNFKSNTLDLSNGISLKQAETNCNDTVTGCGWTTLAITSQKPLKKGEYIIAHCRNNSTSIKRGNRQDITPTLVNLPNNYYWTGTASLISRIEDRGFEYAGVGKDYAVTYNSKKSFTTFQWYASDICSKVKIKGYKESSSSINEVAIKKWNDSSWSSNKCGNSLPCTISAPKLDKYYIIKVKSNANAIKSGYLKTECVQ